MASTSDIHVDLAFFAKKWNKNFGKKGLSYPYNKNMTCYICDEADHFAIKCSYEKREDNPKYERSAKPRLKLNPINERYKKNTGREGKVLVGAEYTSDEDS
jgi:hypothetical protein